MQKLVQSGVKVILNTRVIGATGNSVKLKDDRTISTSILIWFGDGVASSTITEEYSYVIYMRNYLTQVAICNLVSF